MVIFPMKSGLFAQQRNYFDIDQEFPHSMRPSLDGYNHASKMAATSARMAIQSGELEWLRRAQWWEAVTQTIESFLSCAINNTDELNIPEPPSFDIK